MVQVGMLHDDLDTLNSAQLRALAGAVTNADLGHVPRADKRRTKLGKTRVSRPKDFKWENLEGAGLNQTIEVTVQLPAYLVAGSGPDLSASVREGLRDLLIKRGQTWWQPRFLMAVKARQIEAAMGRFTKQ